MFYTTCCMLADFYPRPLERGDKNKKCEGRAFYMKMRTPISYYGGKQNLVSELLPLFPKHIQYVEPFTGGGAVFFAKGKSKNEVINDLDGRLTNFYRVCQTKYDELAEMIKGTAHSEVEHKRSSEILKSENGTDVELAWALWVQTNMSFGHMFYGGFAFREGGKGKATANKRDGFTLKYTERLRNVEIFQWDAVALIKLKDSENTFFYCDPPYVSSDCGHYDGYTKDNFIELLETLKNIKGKFLLSSYPEPDLMEFRDNCKWNYKDIKQVLQVTGKREETKYKTECLTWNYNNEPTLFDL